MAGVDAIISRQYTVSTRFALVVVVCTAPKENRSGVLVSHVHYRGLSTTRFSRNHEWSRLWVLRLSRGYCCNGSVLHVVQIGCSKVWCQELFVWACCSQVCGDVLRRSGRWSVRPCRLRFVRAKPNKREALTTQKSCVSESTLSQCRVQ